MLTTNQGSKTVQAVLRFDMVVDSKRKEKGSVVELSANNFKYLAQHDRVAEATPEYIAAVKAEVEAAKKSAKPSETDALKARIAELEAEVAKKK